MPNDDSFLDNLPANPQELEAEYWRIREHMRTIIDKQSEIHEAAGGRLVELPTPDGWMVWQPPPGPQLPPTEAEEIAMKELNRQEEKLAERRDERELIETKAAILGIQLRKKRQATPVEQEESEELEEEELEDEEPSLNAFFKAGDFWTIIYQGEKLPPIRRLKGLEYIAKLLEGGCFDGPLELIGAVKRIPIGPLEERYKQMTPEQLEEAEGLHKGKSDGHDEIVDKKYLAAIIHKFGMSVDFLAEVHAGRCVRVQ